MKSRMLKYNLQKHIVCRNIFTGSTCCSARYQHVQQEARQELLARTRHSSCGKAEALLHNARLGTQAFFVRIPAKKMQAAHAPAGQVRAQSQSRQVASSSF